MLVVTAAGVVVLSSCNDGTGPGRQSAKPALTRHLDSLFALGDTLHLTLRNSPADVIWQSRDATIARVSQTGRVTAVRPGDSWVLAVNSETNGDSTHVVVRQRVASIVVTPKAISRPLLRVQQFQAQALDTKGSVVPNVNALWSVADATASISGGGLATGNAIGTATVRATASGVTGTALLTVGPLPVVRLTADTIDVGVGQVADGQIPPPRVLADSISESEVFTAQLSLADPSIAEIPLSAVVPEYNGSHTSAQLRVVGVAAGTTRLTINAPRYAPGSAVLRVSTPRLLFQGPATLSANSYNTGFYLLAADSLGTSHSLREPLAVHLRASTPGLVSPSDTVLTMGTGGFLFLPLRAVGSGQTWIVLSAPGYRSDSTLLTLTGPKLRFIRIDFSDLSEQSVGAGEQHQGNLFVFGGCCQFTDLAITLTQKHPEALRIPHSLNLPAGGGYGYVQLGATGIAPGTDTIVATAPGLLPDTLVFRVTTPTYRLDPYPTSASVGSPFTIQAYVADSLGETHFPASGEAKALVRSSDPNVIRPSVDTLVIGNSTGGSFAFRIDGIGPGTATLTLSDPLGKFAPFTTKPITIAATKLLISNYLPGNPPVTVGMHQTTFASVQLMTGGRYAPPIQLRSTDPTIVHTVESSVTIDPNASSANVNLVGGDRAGAAWIVVSGVGLIADSISVEVGKPQVSVVISPLDGLHLELLDQTGNGRRTTEDVTFRIVSTNPGVIAADLETLIVRAGEYQSTRSRVRYAGVGTAAFKAIDDRPVPYAYDAGVSQFIQVTNLTP